jgi:hypothetical protein
MTQVVPLPVDTKVLIDARGGDRALRVSWHPDAGDAGLIVLSLWRGDACIGSFRLMPEDIAPLIDTLTAGLPAGVASHQLVVQLNAAP